MSVDNHYRQGQKIGIFGGSFNPVHTAHLMIAEAARDQFMLDQVIFVPTGHAPHKTFHGNQDQIVRMEMLSAAVQDNPGFAVSDYEFRREEISYSWQTIADFQAQFPEAELYFIIGEDSLYDLETWKYPERILGQAKILVAARSGADDDSVSRQAAFLTEKFGGSISVLDLPVFAISSTFIREQAAHGRSVRYLVPDAVAVYITANGLYQDAHAMRFAEIEILLKDRLKKSRFIHTEGVVSVARHLARIYHYNEEKASMAALLHDCAKHMPDEERIACCEAHGVPVTDSERSNLSLLHAKCGAILAEEVYGVENQEILHAIRVHTTGEAGMNLLDKIIYVADYIEPNRTAAPHLDELRALAETDLDQTVARILSDTLNHLKESGRVIDDTTQKAYDYYKQYL